MATKCFVLDTCVLLYDPNSIKAFEDNKVIIPIYVLEEVDNFKTEQNELGRNARYVSRTLDNLRKKGSLVEGVPIGDGLLQVKFARRCIPDEFIAIRRGIDNKILATALEANGSEEGPVILVTKDINLRVRAAALGLQTEDYISDSVNVSDLYTGTRELIVEPEVIDTLFTEKEADLIDTKVSENSFGILSDGAQKSALVRFYPAENKMRPIRNGEAWGIQARNKEQHFAFELLMDPKVKLVSLIGLAGSGKSLVATAAGLQQVMESNTYSKLSISKPIIPIGRDIGFLPGDQKEKLRPWMQSAYDTLEFLMGISDKEKKRGRSADELFDMGIVEIEPLVFIRGRSIPQQFIVLDEAQNATPHILKTLITRAGEGTKVVLLGDIEQVDNPYIDSTNNGLVHVIDKFKGHPIFGHVTLTKGERSGLAATAAALL